MSAPTTVDDIVNQIQVLRPSLLPGYTEDGDEGERSVDQYIAFYQKSIAEASYAVSDYLHSFQALLEDPHSSASFDAFLAARKLFVKAFPFCEDVLPPKTSVDYQLACKVLRTAFTQKAENSSGNQELQNLQRYKSLLTNLNGLLS